MTISALINLDRSRDEGIVVQLTHQLRRLILDGRIGRGRVLPSSRRLAQDLAVSRNTVTYAVEQLVAEGYLEVSGGRRPVVAAQIGEPVAVPASRKLPRVSPRLSHWASRLNGVDWPMSYRAPIRPLRPGLADTREFPNEIWARCLRRSASRAGRSDPAIINRVGLRHALKEYLQTSRGVRAEADHIIILPTAQAALTLIAAMVIVPGDAAWVEDPGYPGAAAAFRSAGARVIGIKVDEQGMERSAGARAPTLIFTTPSHQHPTGRLMSVARRTELLELARPGRTWIVEDDYDGEFQYDSRPVPALQGLDNDGRVFYVGTFSKATSADIRLGYVVAPPGMAHTMEVAQRHMGLIAAAHVQDALSEFIADGHFLAHIRRMRRLYRGRRDHLVERLRHHLGDVLTVDVPAGGIQLVARLNGGGSDKSMVRRLIEAGVEVRALSSMSLDRVRDHGLLLGFAAWNENEISSAVRVMAACLGGRPAKSRVPS